MQVEVGNGDSAAPTNDIFVSPSENDDNPVLLSAPRTKKARKSKANAKEPRPVVANPNLDLSVATAKSVVETTRTALRQTRDAFADATHDYKTAKLNKKLGVGPVYKYGDGDDALVDRPKRVTAYSLWLASPDSVVDITNPGNVAKYDFLRDTTDKKLNEAAKTRKLQRTKWDELKEANGHVSFVDDAKTQNNEHKAIMDKLLGVTGKKKQKKERGGMDTFL